MNETVLLLCVMKIFEKRKIVRVTTGFAYSSLANSPPSFFFVPRFFSSCRSAASHTKRRAPKEERQPKRSKLNQPFYTFVWKYNLRHMSKNSQLRQVGGGGPVLELGQAGEFFALQQGESMHATNATTAQQVRPLAPLPPMDTTCVGAAIGMALLALLTYK